MRTTPEAIVAMHARAVELYDAGEDRGAVTLLMRARLAAGDSPATAAARTALLLDEGAIHYHRQRFRRAAACYEQAAATLLSDATPILRHDVLERLGDTYRVLGKLDEARATTLAALRAAREAFGPDAAEVASQLNNLGIIEKYRGNGARAVRYYEQALALFERLLGPDHEEVANVLHNLGGIAHERGQYEVGEPFARRGVAIRERLHGPSHPLVAADRVALAALIDGQGRYDEAEAMYREALAVLEATVGPDHYDVASTLRNLAVICSRRGERDNAEAMFLRALAIKRKALGPDHPEVATLLGDLAFLSLERGRRRRATSLMARARSIADALPAAHPVRARTRATDTALRKAIAKTSATRSSYA